MQAQINPFVHSASHVAHSNPRLELIQTALAFWFLGLALAILLGRGTAYIHSSQRVVLAPFGWMRRSIRWIVLRIGLGIRRLTRAALTWLARLIWHW
jgi:hypothetical protein